MPEPPSTSDSPNVPAEPPRQPPSPGTAAPPPGSPFTRLNDGLTAFSALIGTVGAVAAGVAALLSNFARDEAKGAKGEATQAKTSAEAAEAAARQAAMREKNEEASSKFAMMMITQIDQIFSDSPDRARELKLGALDIVAQAASDPEGRMRIGQQHLLSAKMALFRKDPYTLAEIDPTLKVARVWVAIALEDMDEKTWLTAIRALRYRVVSAVEDEDEDLALFAMNHLRQLQERFETKAATMKVVDESPPEAPRPAPVRAPVTTPAPARAATPRSAAASAARPTPTPAPAVLDESGCPPEDVPFFLTYREALAELARLSVYLTKKKWPDPKNLQQHESDPRHVYMVKLFDATTALEQVEKGLGLGAKAIVASAAPQAPGQDLTAALIQEAKQQTTMSGAPSEVDPAKLDGLISQLASPVDRTRREARAQLAAIGQPAIPKLIKQLSDRTGQNLETDYKTRLGVAGALLRMRQPTILTEEEVWWVVELLKSNSAEIRSITVDFLINLEDSETLKHAFKMLKGLVLDQQGNVVEASDDKVNETAVFNAVTVVAGWITALNESARFENDQPLNRVALATAKEWQQQFAAKGERWRNVTARLKMMTERAEARK